MAWEVVIGLETHVQLSTVSKIFSGSPTQYGAAPNTQANPVDMALPGVLPVLNQAAVDCAIKLGLALGAKIAPISQFERKNYFYPDLPKAYQITQQEVPVVQGGAITILTDNGEKTVRLVRAHLEEDAGKSVHEGLQNEDGGNVSGIDLNRAGTPLLEVVTEPDMRSAKEAVAYAKQLHALVQWIGVCDGNMQEGSFRCDANVSVRRPGEPLGTRCEIKNLNSFRFMEDAINYEVQRQIELIEDGGAVVQETRLYDPDKAQTRSMRSKEDAHDYRYFPDPDLPPLIIAQEWIERIKASMPELPGAMKARFEKEFNLSAYDATMLTQSKDFANYFDALVKLCGEPKMAANWMLGELSALLNKQQTDIKDLLVPQAIDLAAIILRIKDSTISNAQAKTLFQAMCEFRQTQNMDVLVSLDKTSALKHIDDIIEQRDLAQVTDTAAIEAIIEEVLAANAKSVEDYKAGKEKAFGALVGQAMKATKGKANPAIIHTLLKAKLGL
jgi:aspartyl-tRNA(Asn)/glutamyl-tRNA(Gln) amidotransferase subunit B